MEKNSTRDFQQENFRIESNENEEAKENGEKPGETRKQSDALKICVES